MSEEPDAGFNNAEHRSDMLRLLGRVSIYYAVLFGALGLLVLAVPSVRQVLPIGGLDVLIGTPDPSSQALADALRSSSETPLNALASQPTRLGATSGDWAGRMVTLFTAMTGSLLLMLPLGWVYRSIHRDHVHDRSLDETTLVLPAVVAGIVVIVQHSLALAFSLAGIVAGVRFRRALTDTFDTLFILTAVGVGIAAGTRSMEIAVVLSVFFSYATMLVSAYGDGLESRFADEHRRLRKAAKQARREAETEQAAQTRQSEEPESGRD